jgi:hypothetical protein
MALWVCCWMVFTLVGGSGVWLLLPLSGCRGKGRSVCSREREGRARGVKICLGGRSWAGVCCERLEEVNGAALL